MNSISKKLIKIINKYINKIKRYLNAIQGFGLINNKTEVAKHLLGIGKKEIIHYKLQNGIILAVPNTMKDRTTILSIKEIFGDEIYPIKQDQHNKIIDLGAQAGIFSIYAAFKCPTARIYSFEPDEDNYSQLLRNISLNNLEKRILPFKKAISNSNKKMKLYLDKSSSRSHTLFSTGKNFILVDSVKLDKLFSSLKIARCDILKVDIEGAEYEVFYNLNHTFFNKINLLFMECHDLHKINKRYEKNSMKEFLLSKGFSIIRELPKENIIIGKHN